MMYWVRDLETGLVYDIEGKVEVVMFVAELKGADIENQLYMNHDFDDNYNQCSFFDVSCKMRMYDQIKKKWILVADAENTPEHDWDLYGEAVKNLNRISGVEVIEYEY